MSGDPDAERSGAGPSTLPDAVDVVVVGAGLAGLRAAQTVARAGRSVVVCEAGDGVGGRVRTDVVDGFLVDRGFQILNTSYPALRAAVDLDALDLRRFVPGAAVRDGDGRLHRLADPRRVPTWAPRTALDGLLGPGDKARIGALTLRALTVPPKRQARAPERSTADELARWGLGGAPTETFLRPFLAGVLGDRDLGTSSRVFSLFWRSFARGDLTLPSRGIGAVTAQLAARLPTGTVLLDTPAEQVTPGAVRTPRGTVRAGAVIVATEGTSAASLLAGRVPPPRTFALTTHFHVTADPPTRQALLHLDGTGGPVVNTMVLTAAAPSYSPDHRHLVASTVLGAEPLRDVALRAELTRIWGTPVGAWDELTTVRVPHALPAAVPPTPAGLRRAVDVGDGLFVAGDHRDTPSVQGALVSGRRTAQEALRYLDAGVASRA
ncbi:phytoene dehydrogenase-like protein [Actinomycetospora succinea]|uniref:Phytoene dehydrogenase-like protein n=1 Tax=Actinomycetospora succinea TaxID=663603 RepID=A0A4R6V656_9PSEU|nr:NAD(P)/FAD-dependent oxidoreductase [Actinomycetospora succinea]TDQ55753.1 phytoene dehydrogenase-like protein [Actinomycetospora succinea]